MLELVLELGLHVLVLHGIACKSGLQARARAHTHLHASGLVITNERKHDLVAGKLIRFNACSLMMMTNQQLHMVDPYYML